MAKSILVELDWKALEAQLVGHFARDPYYVRAAKLGVHTILMSHIIGKPVDLNLPNDSLRRTLKDIKASDPKLYNTSKTIVHMSNYLGSAKKIRMDYPDEFESVKSAKEKQDIYFATIARKVRKWQMDTLYEAFKQHFLDTPYGVRHYFWDPCYYMGKELIYGQDAKRCVAFRPQSTGASMLSEVILDLWKFPDIFRYIRQLIHDSILMEVPIIGYQDYIKVVKEIMEKPRPELDGLSVEVEVKVGENLGEMVDYE